MTIPESHVPSITALIDQRHEALEVKHPRPYMGISSIGHVCDRWLWFQFRWAVIESFPGRMLRLFARGQREEALMVAELRGIGIVIHNTEDDQAEVSLGGWVKGHLDGIIDSGVPEAPKTPHVWENKTHNKKSFDELERLGVKEAKPMHWAQMQCYMLGKGLSRALYTAVCKDDDRIYTERVRFDSEASRALVRRGQSIALEDHIPAPISLKPEWYQCKCCPGWDLCHGTRCTHEVNCRTCAHFTAHEDETCTCAFYSNSVIPPEAQYVGCANHVLHPDLVPWSIDRSLTTSTMAVYQIGAKKYANGCGGFQSADLIALYREQKQ
ncbi:MAG: hypothetical protein WCU80_00190 [Paludibacteraceae bacterium]